MQLGGRSFAEAMQWLYTHTWYCEVYGLTNLLPFPLP